MYTVRTEEVAGSPVRMTLPVSPSLSSYRTMNLSSVPLSSAPVSPGPFSHGSAVSTVSTGLPVQYVTNGTGVQGNVMYETVRYLVPVERRMPESYVMVDNRQTLLAPPTYLQRVSVSSADDPEFYRQQQCGQQQLVHISTSNSKAPSVFSQSPSPAKSPEISPSETQDVLIQKEMVSPVSQVSQVSHVSQVSQVVEEPLTKMDTRFFGELLAEVYRKNGDIFSCLSEHVEKIRGRKHHLDPTINYKVEKDEVEALIPKGASELTKQQIRYLLETRLTADKTLRLLLTTFSSLREELLHLQDDLRRLESDKESLERDLSFKADQAAQYDRLLESVRENNRQLQLSLKESNMALRSMESQLLSTKHSDSDRDYRLKELECSKKALEEENEILRQKLSGQSNSTTIQVKTEQMSRHYNEMLNSLREEKDKELQTLRAQFSKMQTEFSSKSSGDQSLHLRITELISTLEQKETIIRRQEEDLRRLESQRADAANQSKSVTKTIITKKYRNQYPILGLLSDDYQATSPIKEAKTIVIERTGEMYKQEIITTP
ncbi:protein POF1B isoform X1 [Amia ocellicauda]|uniref:protein POF1B isoform X1 n=1 Tax=Amia ocellicauda TaxID=2972642 RepID=UPI003464D589